MFPAGYERADGDFRARPIASAQAPAELVCRRHGHRHRGQRRGRPASARARAARVRDGGVGAGGRLADRADPGLDRSLGPVSRTGPGSRRQPGDGAVLGGAGDGPDDGGHRDAAPRAAPDRPRGGAWRGLGTVARRDGARPGDRGLDPVPDDDAARHRGRGRVRRLADAGRPADGLGRHRRAADPARRLGAGPADAAARLLRHVRHQPVRLGDHHYADLVAPGDTQAQSRGHGADDVDRARPARPVRDRGRETWAPRPPGSCPSRTPRARPSSPCCTAFRPGDSR
jgi:hypothetical protein